MINDHNLKEYYKNQAKKRMQDFKKEQIINKWLKVIEEV